MAAEERDHTEVSVGNVQDVSGEVNVAGGDIYKGYTAEQVSALLQEITLTFQPKPFDGRCPYKGLDFFEEEDAEFFFGRERIVADLVQRLRESRTIFIAGASGSGKSSLVRAGLIAALKGGAIAESHSDHWLYATIMPGREPLEALALAFSRLKSPELADYYRQHIQSETILNDCAESALSEHKDQRLVLFIDQFEETFTQVGRDKAQIFIQQLTHAATLQSGRMSALFALRSDFLSNVAAYPTLNEMLSRQFIQIGAMEPAELVSAIAQPALRVGLRIDPDLIAQIINDMKGEPGALPLVQFALKDLFDAEQAQGGMMALTRDAYLKRGGIHQALQRHADAAFLELGKTEQELARSIFSHLIKIDSGGQVTRRYARFADLAPTSAKSQDVRDVIQKLENARLITTDEREGDKYSIAHERLIEAWPWLKRLIADNRVAIELQNEISADAKEWDEHQRDPSYLYSGARLAIAQKDLRHLTLSEDAQNFLDAGIRTEENVRRQRARGQRRIVMGLVGFSAVLVVLLILALFQLNISRAQQLGVQAQVVFAQGDWAKAALLAREANQIHENSAANLALRNVHQQLFGGAGRIVAQPHITHVAWSADGRLALGTRDGTITIWGDFATGRPDQSFARKADLTGLAWSADGRLASRYEDGTIIIWNAANGTPAQTLEGTYSGSTLAWSPDGRLAFADGPDVLVWDFATGRPAETLKGHTSTVTGIAWSLDGRLASGSDDHTIIIWNLASGKPAQTLEGSPSYVTDIAWSSDGRLASGTMEDVSVRCPNTCGTVTIWDLSTGRPAWISDRYGSAIQSLAWAPDDLVLASSFFDGTINTWDFSTKRPVQTLVEDTKTYGNIAWSSRDGRLAVASDDGTVQFDISLSFHENLCWFIRRNMTLQEWLEYQGPLYVYRPACPDFDDPTKTLHPIRDFLKSIRNPDPFQDPSLWFSEFLVTWKGRAALFTFIAVVLAIPGFVLWVFYKSARWGWHKMRKQGQEEPHPA